MEDQVLPGNNNTVSHQKCTLIENSKPISFLHNDNVVLSHFLHFSLKIEIDLISLLQTLEEDPQAV